MFEKIPEEPLYGVNLGGWLVLERWLTPTLFKGYLADDERSFMREKGARQRLKKHRETFIVEADFAWLQRHGANAVRIPVGYWLFGDEEPYQDCLSYLDQALRWAKKYNLKVIIDLHRVPGSADGHDTGNEVAKYAWFYDRNLQQETLKVLEKIAKRYGENEQVWGIEIMNEPKIAPGRVRILKKFYQQAYDSMTPFLRPGMVVIFSDGFSPLIMNGSIKFKKVNPAVMDVHFYHFSMPFDGWRSLSCHLRKTNRRKWLIKWLSRKQPIIVGEWSGVISGEKMRKIPAAQRPIFEDRYISAQQKIHAQAAGQFYWNYKTENPGIWGYRSLVEAGRVDGHGLSE